MPRRHRSLFRVLSPVLRACPAHGRFPRPSAPHRSRHRPWRKAWSAALASSARAARGRASSRSIRPDTAILSVLVATVRSTPTGSSAGSSPLTYSSTRDLAQFRVAGRLRVAREALVDPALRHESARRLHRAPRQGQPPPARQGVVHGRAQGCCAPTAAPLAGLAGPGSSSGTCAGSQAKWTTGLAYTSTAASASPRNRAVPFPSEL